MERTFSALCVVYKGPVLIRFQRPSPLGNSSCRNKPIKEPHRRDGTGHTSAAHLFGSWGRLGCSQPASAQVVHVLIKTPFLKGQRRSHFYGTSLCTAETSTGKVNKHTTTPPFVPPYTYTAAGPVCKGCVASRDLFDLPDICTARLKRSSLPLD